MALRPGRSRRRGRRRVGVRPRTARPCHGLDRAAGSEHRLHATARAPAAARVGSPPARQWAGSSALLTEPYAARVLDAESVLRNARRPLVIGMGGGGDVVGALATAERMRRYDGAEPVLGGLAWERRPIDPMPGPRRPDEIADATELAGGVLRAGPHTRVRDREVYFAESRMAQFLGEPTLLIDIGVGPAAVAAGLSEAASELGCDLVVFIDVGGDVLAQGDEPGLRSPLCDAVMLAAAGRLGRLGTPVLAGVF